MMIGDVYGVRFMFMAVTVVSRQLSCGGAWWCGGGGR
jgi:hypothetical protein